MKQSDDKAKTGRRDFLKLAGGGAIAGTAAVVGSAAPVAAADESDDREASLYRETEHIKTVYKLARF